MDYLLKSLYNTFHYIIIGEDLKGFKPNMYRLMQRSQTPWRIGLMYNHVFEQERNRVQFIADWPTENDANIISSLQVSKLSLCHCIPAIITSLQVSLCYVFQLW